MTFTKANELAILFAARKLEWVSQAERFIPPDESTPTAGVAIPKSAVRVVIAVSSVVGTADFDVYGYVEELERWFRIPGAKELFTGVDSSGLAERISPAGFQRICVQTVSSSDECLVRIGYSVLE